ncbi:MAG: ABC transporter permease [Chloroflexi bacterium]|nr:ABC transporter permease [Chloroflexota bacterium]MCL5950899.1 ABC transporter permease [Chloroflexota bacterium]
MARYITQRLVIAVITLLGVSTIVFLMLHLLPGDPARMIAGLLASDQDIARIRIQLGLDKPLVVQYLLFLGNLLHGNLGISARTSDPVLTDVLQRLPATIELAVISTALATLVGILAGVIAATRPNTILDYVLSALTLFGVSMPVYWLGLMLIIVFAVNLHMLPAAGDDSSTSFILPSLTLAAFSVALIARMTRASMLEVLGQDYVRTARAKGMRENRVLLRHALKNAFIPILTVIGLQFGTLLGGAILTESVFGWPGIGLLLVDSIFARDYPMVQGIVLVFSTLFILLNLGVDLLYAYFDPRIHFA